MAYLVQLRQRGGPLKPGIDLIRGVMGRLFLSSDGLQRQIQVYHSPDFGREGTGRIDHDTALKNSPMGLYPAHPFLIHLNPGGFGVDEKPGVTAFGKSLGCFMT